MKKRGTSTPTKVCVNHISFWSLLNLPSIKYTGHQTNQLKFDAAMERPTNTDISQTTPLTAPTDDLAEDVSPFPSASSQELDKAEILRQVEHYFSDENLESDAHLLGKLQEGNGTVSVKHILGFKRMRKYKPASAVRDILKESTFIEIIDNKRIRRRQPFDMSKAKVTAKINQDEETTKRKAALEANPYLTKNMLKRTGFEHDHVEPELSTEEKQAELEQYSTEHPIYERIETAVLKYKMNRKLHQETLRVFHAFLEYGGFEQRPNMFTGGVSKEDEESLSKEEKARRKQINFVSNDVIHSLSEQDGNWVVDFEGVTKGFFSTLFSEQFLWHDDLQHDKHVANAACNVLRNFFNYLLYHNVCAEYTDQIHAARDSLEAIESELLEMAAVQKVFPGAFNIACSTFFKGYYANIYYQGDWMDPDEAAAAPKGFSRSEAKGIVYAGIAAFASPEKIDHVISDSTLHIVSTEEDVGLEVIEIVPARYTSAEAQELFSKLKNTVVPAMGKLVCKRYHFPNAAPLDIPPDLPPGPDEFTFLMDEDTLGKCYLGLKFTVTVKELNAGLYFIDHWTDCYGTFYTWCWNERARDLKEYGDRFELLKPGNPTASTLFLKQGEALEDSPTVDEFDTPQDTTRTNRMRIEFTMKDYYDSDSEDAGSIKESHASEAFMSSRATYGSTIPGDASDDDREAIQKPKPHDPERRSLNADSLPWTEGLKTMPVRGWPANPIRDEVNAKDASGDDSFFSDEEGVE